MKDPKVTYGQIGKAAAVIVVLTAFDKVLALTKEMLVAYRFGVSPALDTFNVAYALPATILLYFSGAFSAAFVPAYLGWSHDDPSAERADNHARAVLLCTSTFFCGLTAIGFIFSPAIFPVLGYGLAPTEKSLGVTIERTLAFLLLFEGSGIVLASLLHAKKRFYNLYLAPTLINATTILFILCGSGYGIHALVWGLLAGTVLKFLYLTLSVRRSGFRIFAGMTWDREELTRFLLLVLPLLGSELIANSNILIDMIMATQLPPGAASTLRYAYRVNELPVHMIIMAISKAILPYISEQAIENNIDGLRYIFWRSITLLGFITFPVMSIVLIFSHDMISILFERGAFDANATYRTAQTLVCYNIGLFFTAYAFVNGAFFCALKRTKVLLYMGCVCFVLNVAFNYIFMNMFGIKGIALSTSATLAIICTVFFYLLQKTFEMRERAKLFFQLSKTAVAAACTLFMGMLLKGYIGGFNLGQTLTMIVVVLLMMGSYLSLTWLFRVEEARIGMRSIRSRFAGKG